MRAGFSGAARPLAVFVLALALGWGAAVGRAHASPSCLNAFTTRYPGSTTSAAGCAVCHAGSTSRWNAYGSFLQQRDTTGCADPPLAAAEGVDSDGIAGTNLEEIQANAQPGWCDPATPGCDNQAWDRNGAPSGAATPPAGVLLDPVPVADTQAPTAPTDLIAAWASATQIDLSWTAATDNVGVASYRVERCAGSGCTAFAWIGTTPGTTTAYSDVRFAATARTPRYRHARYLVIPTFNRDAQDGGGAELGTSATYRYRVQARDAAGNLGAYSNMTTPPAPGSDTQAPTAPGNLTAAPVSASRIGLSWTAAADNTGVTGYLVERCQGPGCITFAQIGTAPGTAAVYDDGGLAPSTSYRYRVRATDAAGNRGPYSGVAGAATPAATVPPVAAYSFNEGAGTTVLDASGRGNAGTLAGATWTAQGKYGGALVFDGNALVTVPSSPWLELTTGMTLEAWVRPSAVASEWQDVIYKDVDNYYLEATTTSAGAPGAGGTFGIVYGAEALPVGVWAHLAATYDRTYLRLYVNGVEVAALAAGGAIASSTSPLTIGGDGSWGQYFRGTIDEVRVYDTALTAAEIQTDMNTPVAEGTLDTEAPTAPGNLQALLAGGGRIDLSWSAATDNAGVTGYELERCEGMGCSSFARIATTAGTATAYSDAGLAARTTYRYRLRAADAAGNLGPWSSEAQATTGDTITPRAAVLTFTQQQQFVSSLSGAAWSVDGIAGGSPAAGTITAGGLYTPPAAVGSHTVMATDGLSVASATVHVSDFPGMFTHRNDNTRTGQNPRETVLAPANLNAVDFGKLFSYPVDGIAHASPLYVANLAIPGHGFRNVVYVATEHDSVYAFDADGSSPGPLWQASFIDPAAGVTTVPAGDTGECCDIAPEIGITGTPVIDPTSGTLYVVAKTKEVAGPTTSYVQRLHALDIATGAEKLGGPVVIEASVPGTGDGSQGGQVPFHPLRENQRAALLLHGGVVYVAFASHGDQPPYHGWVLGYDAATLQQVLAWNATPDAEGAGIWQSGGGPAADAEGNLHFVTGDGTFDADTGGNDYGDSFVKLGPGGQVLDHFTPFDQAILDVGNHDLGASGVLLLPDQPGPHPRLEISAGKNSKIYLIDRDDMGRFNPVDDSQIVQWLFIPGYHVSYSPPAYFDGTVYLGSDGGTLQAYRLTDGRLPFDGTGFAAPTSQSATTYAFPGAMFAISSDASAHGLVWAVERHGATGPAVLHAYDATNLAVELYDSNQAGARDALDPAAKYSIPLVANGKVFVVSAGRLTAFGLLP